MRMESVCKSVFSRATMIFGLALTTHGCGMAYIPVQSPKPQTLRFDGEKSYRVEVVDLTLASAKEANLRWPYSPRQLPKIGSSNYPVTPLAADTGLSFFTRGSSQSAQFPETAPPPYRIGVGDTLVVLNASRQDQSNTFFSGPDVQNRYIVSRGGTIFVPEIGEVDVAGKSLQEVRSEIQTKMSNVFVSPSIIVNIIGFASQSFSISGPSVRTAVEFLTDAPLNLRDALLEYGTANTIYEGATVKLVRDNREYSVPYIDILERGLGERTIIRDGDDIRVIDEEGIREQEAERLSTVEAVETTRKRLQLQSEQIEATRVQSTYTQKQLEVADVTLERQRQSLVLDQERLNIEAQRLEQATRAEARADERFSLEQAREERARIQLEIQRAAEARAEYQLELARLSESRLREQLDLSRSANFRQATQLEIAKSAEARQQREFELLQLSARRAEAQLEMARAADARQQAQLALSRANDARQNEQLEIGRAAEQRQQQLLQLQREDRVRAQAQFELSLEAEERQNELLELQRADRVRSQTQLEIGLAAEQRQQQLFELQRKDRERAEAQFELSLEAEGRQRELLELQRADRLRAQTQLELSRAAGDRQAQQLLIAREAEDRQSELLELQRADRLRAQTQLELSRAAGDRQAQQLLIAREAEDRQSELLELQRADRIRAQTQLDISREAGERQARQLLLQEESGRRAEDQLSIARTGSKRADEEFILKQRADARSERELRLREVMAEDSLGLAGDEFVYVGGEVGLQSRIPFPIGSSLTLADALFEARGFNPTTADPRGVHVVRSEDTGVRTPTVYVFKLDVSNVANLSTATVFEMRPGDVLYVTPQPVTNFSRLLSQSLGGGVGTILSVATRNL